MADEKKMGAVDRASLFAGRILLGTIVLGIVLVAAIGAIKTTAPTPGGQTLAEQKKEAPAQKEKTAAEKQADCEKRHPGSKYSPEVNKCVQKFTDAEEVRKLYPDLAALDCAGRASGEKVEKVVKGEGYTDLVRQTCP